MLSCSRFQPCDGVWIHLVASESRLQQIELGATNVFEGCDRHTDSHSPLLREAVAQLRAYFAGDLRRFDLPIEMGGTEFQKRVWRALQGIPYGQTRSYGCIAAEIGHPKAVRAVGGANSKNRLPILVPCHRVIANDGTLGGFAGGLRVKELLLNLESVARR